MPETKFVWKIRDKEGQGGAQREKVRLCARYLRRGQILQWLRGQRPREKFTSEDAAQVFGHHGLLLHRAVIFQGQD